MTFQESLAMGRLAEDEFLKRLSSSGYHVISVYTAGEGKAPRVYTDRGAIAAADVLAISKNGEASWFEVKAKSKPGYRYTGKFRGWHHGIDLRLFQGAYKHLAARCKFWFVVCETKTIPGDASWEPPPRGAGWNDYERYLVPGPVWRIISYDNARKHGREVPSWSGGRPGWLWPVGAMKRLTFGGQHA